MADRYIYPALFHYEENQVGVTFPDLPGCVTVSKDETDAIKCAKEALGLHIYGMEVDGEPIPTPSSIKRKGRCLCSYRGLDATHSRVCKRVQRKKDAYNTCMDGSCRQRSGNKKL